MTGRCQAVPSKKGSTDSYQEGPGRWPLPECGMGVCVPGTVLKVPEGAVVSRAGLGSCSACRLVGKQLIVQRTEKEREQRRVVLLRSCLGLCSSSLDREWRPPTHSLGGGGFTAFTESASEQVFLWQVPLKALHRVPAPPAACINQCSKHKRLFRADSIRLLHKHRFSGRAAPNGKVKEKRSGG